MLLCYLNKLKVSPLESILPFKKMALGRLEVAVKFLYFENLYYVFCGTDIS